jgi:integrase
MSTRQRHKTKYPGVIYRIPNGGYAGQTEKVFYAIYKQDGKVVEAKIGGQVQHGMTAAKANAIRSEYMNGKRLTPQAQRVQDEAEREKRLSEDEKTFQRLWLHFAEEMQEKGNTSYKDDRSRWEKHLAPVFGDKTPDEIITLDLDRLKAKLKRDGLSPATTKHILGLLRRIINFSVIRGRCPRVDPGRLHFAMPKLNNEKTEDLSPDELSRLITAIDQSPDWKAAGVLRLAMLTGMRRGELLALKWGDIDFDKGFLRIVSPKGGKDASIPLNETALRVLHGLPRTESVYVFPGRNGARSFDLKKPISTIKKAAGLPVDFRPCHGLRHFFASTLASSGKVDLHTIQRLLNHQSPSMTQRYAHLRDEAMREASNVMNAIMEDVG